VICGGVTERILTRYGMKRDMADVELRHHSDPNIRLVDAALRRSNSVSDRVHHTFRDTFKRFDNGYLKPLFGGSDESGTSLAGEEAYHESEMKGWLEGSHNESDDEEAELKLNLDVAEQPVEGDEHYEPPTTPNGGGSKFERRPSGGPRVNEL